MKLKNIYKYLLLFLIIFLFGITNVKADNKIDLYLFHSDSCPHCKKEIDFLNELKKEYSNLNIHYYEVSKNKKNSELMEQVKDVYLQKGYSVPFTVVGKRSFTGYNESFDTDIKNAIKECSKKNCYNFVNDIIKGKKVDLDEEKKDSFNIPILGNIDAKTVSLPLISIIIGIVDGFNPCAMWILIFLISMLLGMKDKKRMWILGLTFLITSALVYLLFMVSWLNIAINFTNVVWIRNIIGVIALVSAYLNLKSYIKTKDTNGCTVTNDKKRKKIIHKIKDIVKEKSFILALLGIMVLAFSVNLIELACSAGLPLIFTQILSFNNLSGLEYSFYILLYIIFFLLDDIIVFTVAMISLKITGISTKYTKYSHLIGGIIMLTIGLLMILKPEWLMFNL